jgi:hypothetical protein
MKLFSCEDGFSVVIEPEILLIKEFHDLYMDRKANENLILKELAYIYFMYEISSDFQQNGNEEERSLEVVKHTNLPSTWIPDEFIIACSEVYVTRSETMTSGLLKDTYGMVQKIREELKLINLSEKDKMGKPVYNLKQIIETTRLIPGLIAELNKAEKEYVKGQAEVNKNKGSKTKTMYEDM